jgi:hypothetical protein
VAPAAACFLPAVADAAGTPAAVRPAAAKRATAAHALLPWVSDYDRAIADARARKVPIFVEAWAPW